MISAVQRYEKKFVDILGRKMAYVEAGKGDPIVFLHGNPMSSYLWRNVMPHLEDQGRCIAPDLMGMGDSDKLDHSGPDAYRFVDHRQFLDILLAKIGATWCLCCTTGARRSASTGRTATAAASRASPTWRRSSSR